MWSHPQALLIPALINLGNGARRGEIGSEGRSEGWDLDLVFGDLDLRNACFARTIKQLHVFPKNSGCLVSGQFPPCRMCTEAEGVCLPETMYTKALLLADGSGGVAEWDEQMSRRAIDVVPTRNERANSATEFPSTR